MQSLFESIPFDLFVQSRIFGKYKRASKIRMDLQRMRNYKSNFFNYKHIPLNFITIENFFKNDLSKLLSDEEMRKIISIFERLDVKKGI